MFERLCTQTYAYTHAYTQIRDGGGKSAPPPSRIGLIRKNLILLVSSVRLVLSALPLRIRSPRFREVSGIGTLITVITIVLPIWGNSCNTLLYSSKVKWSWSMCLFYSQYENISPRHIFLFFIPIALFIFPTLYLYILLIRCRKNLQPT